MPAIDCTSYVLNNQSGIIQTQNFTDCNGNPCSVTVDVDNYYIITADSNTFIENPDLKISQYKIDTAFVFTGCCYGDVFYVLGSSESEFVLTTIINKFGPNASICISEFTNQSNCSINSTLSLGCYGISGTTSPETVLGTEMYISYSGKYAWNDCTDCIKASTEGSGCPTCCYCYQVVSEGETLIIYTDCNAKRITTSIVGTSYFCSATDPEYSDGAPFTFTNLGKCSESPYCCSDVYCLSNTGNDYDDSYTLTDIYDGYNYYQSSSGSYFIYYDTFNQQWCLSDSLGGICYLSGKSPCFSNCPDLCEAYFTKGECPTTTTTTLPCITFDFDAIFDCLVPDTPTPTPTQTMTPTPSPTPSVNLCVEVYVDATIDTYSPTPTPTPTQTPTPSPVIERPCNVLGDVSFTTVDGQFDCPTSKQFQDCINGMMYYTTNSVPTPSGDTLEQFMIFKAYVDGDLKCISYVGINNDIIGVNTIDLVEGPIGYSNLGDCVSCIVVPSPTPTPTLTMTPTPSGIPCYCYELMSDLLCKYSYIDCNGVSQKIDTSNLIPEYVCSLTTPIGTSLNPYSVTKLDICSDGVCPRLVCKCYTVSNGGLPKGTSSGISVVYYDCDNKQQVIHVNDYSVSAPFCSTTTPFITTTGHITTTTIVGDCVDGVCQIIM